MLGDFFPQAFIYGLDIETRYFFEDERIKCFYTDQSDENELEKTIIEIQNSLIIFFSFV